MKYLRILGLMLKTMTGLKHICPTSAVHQVIKTSWLTPGLGISSVEALDSTQRRKKVCPAAANSPATGPLYSTR